MSSTNPIQVEFTQEFKAQLRRLKKRYRSIQKDLAPLLESLLAGETPGDQVPNTGYKVFKVRLSNRDAQRGKSGGYRVIYWLETANKRLLIDIYSKSDQSNLDSSLIHQIIERLEEENSET